MWRRFLPGFWRIPHPLETYSNSHGHWERDRDWPLTWLEGQRKSSISGATIRQITSTSCNNGQKLETKTSAPNGEMIAIIIGGNGQIVQLCSGSGIAGIGQTGTATWYQQSSIPNKFISSIDRNIRLNRAHTRWWTRRALRNIRPVGWACIFNGLNEIGQRVGPIEELLLDGDGSGAGTFNVFHIRCCYVALLGGEMAGTSPTELLR